LFYQQGFVLNQLTDNWIPNYAPGSLTLLAPIPDGATVDFLLQDDHGAWDVDVVRAVFEEEVANQVLQIQISRSVGVDFLSWPHTKFGDYCGDPAYHCMCTMQVVDITPMKHRLTSITSIRVVQQKHRRSKVCL
jgi:hypothetical protein